MYGGAGGSSHSQERSGSGRALLGTSTENAASTAASTVAQSLLMRRAEAITHRKPPVTMGHSDKASSLFHQQSAVLEEEEQLIELFGEDHWRVKVYKLLHKHAVILFLAGLMLVDILLLVVGLVLEGAYPECSQIRDRVGCVVVRSMMGKETVLCDMVCYDPPESVEAMKYFMTLSSILILLMFVAELLLHWAAIGSRRFCHNLFLLFDFCIVLVSLWLEIVMTMHERNHEQDDVQAITVPLLVFSRSWRLLRLGHGTLKEAHDYYEQKMQDMELEIASLRERLAAGVQGDEGGL